MLIYVICTCIESLFAHFCTSVHVLGVNLVHFLARKRDFRAKISRETVFRAKKTGLGAKNEPGSGIKGKN